MLRESRPRGEVGMGALLCPRSIPRWSASETQDRRQAETQRARTKKNSGSAAREETGAKASRTLERPDAMVRWLRPAFGRIAQRSLRVLGEVAMRKLFLSHQSPLGFRQVDPHALTQHVPLIKTLEFVHLVE